MSEQVHRRTRRVQFPQLQPVRPVTTISLESPTTRSDVPLPFTVEKCISALKRVWKWAQDRNKNQRKTRKLRICESAQLGDKKFIALIQADGQRFLIGGTSNSVSLLATLPSRKNFKSLLQKETRLEVREG
jgi:hypothetical protein